MAKFHDSRVLLVDMDHQSSLSIIALGTDGWTDVTSAGETVTKIFRNFPGSELPGREIVRNTSFSRRTYAEKVDIVPAGLDLDNTEIELTSSHQGETTQSAWNKRTLVCRWLEETKLDEDYDYIVFDCAPATKVVSQNAIAASHGYVLPVVPEAVMERGAPHLRAMIQSGIDQKLQDWAEAGEARSMFVPDTKLIALVVTRIQTHGRAYSGYTNDHTQHVRRLKREWGNRLIKPYIEHGVGVGEVLTAGVPVYERRWAQNVGGRGFDTMFEELTAKLKARIDKLKRA